MEAAGESVARAQTVTEQNTDAGPSARQAGGPSLSDPGLFLNRELSLLAFQRRVLEEAEDAANPLLERVKFLSIFYSNLDEFFMVRVAAIKQQVASGTLELSIDGRSATEQLVAIRAEVKESMEEAHSCWLQHLLPALAEARIHLLSCTDLTPEESQALHRYFLQTVFPVLTPLGFDPGRPFPHISNLSLNLAVVVRDSQGLSRFARLKVPEALPQLVHLTPAPAGGVEVRPGASARAVAESATGESALRFIWLEDLIVANLQSLFPGLEIVEAYSFRITRDAEVAIQELESDDLLETVEEAVWGRRFRTVVRLQVDESMPETIRVILRENLQVDEDDVYSTSGPLDLTRLGQLQSIDRPELKYKSFLPATPSELKSNSKDDIFSVIRRDDVLLHHPFESFQPVVEFLRSAAHDPDVLAIKMTLYRVGRNSPIVQALLDAVEEGKQVSVLVELKARFDEESNIEWARALEAQGVHVVYGLMGLKVHSKVALVVRREGEVMRRYVHLGTGNYNPITARIYTDLSLFTCDEAIASDTSELFNRLTGYSEKIHFRKLLVAPVDLRRRMEELIEREIRFAERGERARLIFKMNAIDDAEMIRLLYRASQAGVKVDLLVRGICCLRPGLDNVSESIRVISIVGRFLEHSRIYYFRNGGREEVYVGSADLMPRNLNRRIEVVFPIQARKLVKRLKEDVLDLYLSDNVNARVLQGDGTYAPRRRTKSAQAIDAQAQAMLGR